MENKNETSNQDNNSALHKTDVIRCVNELRLFRSKLKSEAKWHKERGKKCDYILQTMKQIDLLTLDLRDRFEHIV